MILLAKSKYVEQLFEIIGEQPAFFLLGLVLLCVAAVSAFLSPRLRLVVVGLTLYMATLQRPKETPWYSLVLAPGLQTLSNYSRVITLGLLAVLSVAGLFATAGHRRKLLSAPLVAFLLFEYLNCLKITTGGDTLLAFSSFVTFTLIFLAMAMAAGKTVQDVNSAKGLLLAIVGAGALVILGTLYQFTVRPGAVFAGATPRLYATLGHPQKAGLLFALITPIAIYLTVHWRRYAWAKPVLIAIASISVVGIATSGSRTAMLAALVGCGVLFRHKLSLGLVVTATVLGCGIGVLQQFAALKTASDRLFITTNTRAAAWSEMYTQFKDNPLFGANITTSGTGESSFLGAAARMGFVGIFAVSLLTILIALMIYKLNHARKSLGQDASLADLVIGGLAAMGVACVLDQYLFDTVTFFNMFIYLYLALGTALLEFSRRAEAVALQTTRAVRPVELSEPSPYASG